MSCEKYLPELTKKEIDILIDSIRLSVKEAKLSFTDALDLTVKLQESKSDNQTTN